MDMKEFIDTITSTGQRMVLDHEMVANWCEHFDTESAEGHITSILNKEYNEDTIRQSILAHACGEYAEAEKLFTRRYDR